MNKFPRNWCNFQLRATPSGINNSIIWWQDWKNICSVAKLQIQDFNDFNGNYIFNFNHDRFVVTTSYFPPMFTVQFSHSVNFSEKQIYFYTQYLINSTVTQRVLYMNVYSVQCTDYRWFALSTKKNYMHVDENNVCSVHCMHSVHSMIITNYRLLHWHSTVWHDTQYKQCIHMCG